MIIKNDSPRKKDKPAVQKNPPVIIVYHENCIDGAASAWIIAKAAGIEDGARKNNALFIPYDHADPAAGEDKIRAALSSGGDIYFADITPEKDFLDALLAAGNDIHILDHHKSAAETLKDKNAPRLHLVFDPAAPSAAGMIWAHFFPSQTPPAVVALIDLMDGAANGLKTPEDFAAAALVDSKSIRTPESALETLRGLAMLSFNDMAKKGLPIAAAEDARIDELFENAAVARIRLLPDTDAVDVPVVNGHLKGYGRAISARLVELGAACGANAAFMWWLEKNGAVTMSIRTGGDPDASAIARHICKTTGATGGGHDGAAAVHFASLADFAKHVKITRPAAARKIRREPPSPG